MIHSGLSTDRLTPIRAWESRMKCALPPATPAVPSFLDGKDRRRDELTTAQATRRQTSSPGRMRASETCSASRESPVTLPGSTASCDRVGRSSSSTRIPTRPMPRGTSFIKPMPRGNLIFRCAWEPDPDPPGRQPDEQSEVVFRGHGLGRRLRHHVDQLQPGWSGQRLRGWR